MEILFWLLPAVLATVVAMIWVGVLGRNDSHEDRSVAARARRERRFAEAIARPNPVAAPQPTPERRGDRSTGITVRGRHS